MKKFINNPEEFVNESLEGILSAYPRYLRSHPNDIRAIARSDFTKDDDNRVSIITGGGYGHIPLFLGYVGDGLCSGVAVGEVFTTPSSDTILRATEMVPQKKGVLYIFGNYTGDCINFSIAAKQLLLKGTSCAQIIISDDVTSAPRERWHERRSIAGLVLAYKIAGACAKLGYPLQKIVEILSRVNENMGSIGIALTSCCIPKIAKPIFEITEDEIEIGIGIHGEPGVERAKLMPSRELAAYMVDSIVDDLSLQKGERVALLVNSMGGTPKDELYILYNDVRHRLDELSINIVFSFAGEYVTSLEMSGASVTMLRYEDEYGPLLGAEAFSPFVYFKKSDGYF